MSDERTGKALMKAVAEAVGWEWQGTAIVPWASDEKTRGIRGRGHFHSDGPISWDDAMAACEAAGIKHLIINWSSKSTQIVYEWSNEAWVKVKGTSPESLCRALLAAIEARK